MNEYRLDELDKNVREFNYAYEHDDYSCKKEYLAFSSFFQNCFVTSDYIVDTGNFQTCNLVFINRFNEKIKRHQLLFRIFRFIFGV